MNKKHVDQPGITMCMKRKTTTATMSKPTRLQINIAKKTLIKKMQKLVEGAINMIMIVLKLLNGYIVIPVYYECILHVLVQN